MKEWQFDVLFAVGVGGAIFLLVAGAFGFGKALENPILLGPYGLILGYVLNQKKNIVKKDETKREDKSEDTRDVK